MTDRRSFMGKAVAGVVAFFGIGYVKASAKRDDLSWLLLGERCVKIIQVTPLMRSEKVKEGYLHFSSDLDLRIPSHNKFYGERLAWHIGDPDKGFIRTSVNYSFAPDGNDVVYRIVDQEVVR